MFFFEEEDRKKCFEYIKNRGDFIVEKVKLSIDIYFQMSIEILKVQNKKGYDIFVDEQLSQMSEYMKKEKENMIESFSNDERKYVEIINTLTEKINELEKENNQLKKNLSKKELPLTNKNVLVVGDTGRKEFYREVVERYVGNFDFIDGIFETEKINLFSEKADLAILVIPRIKHQISNVLKSNKVPSIFVNSAGINSFEEVVQKYCS